MGYTELLSDIYLANYIHSGDWLLRYVYRATNAQLSIAGLNEIDLKDNRIQNVDLTQTVRFREINLLFGIII